VRPRRSRSATAATAVSRGAKRIYDGGDGEVFTASATSGVVEAGESAEVRLTFTPTAAISYSDTASMTIRGSQISALLTKTDFGVEYVSASTTLSGTGRVGD